MIYGKTRILFMGDAETEIESGLLRSGLSLQAEVLKAGHHGSRTSSSLPFLIRVKPRAGVISVGEGNRFGHPSPSVLRNLQNLGISVFRTDRHGAVIFESRGDSLRRVEWR
jgi:competence protein ComEC